MSHETKSADDVRHHRSASGMPAAYLAKWLQMFRGHGYATQDDSWGELEKILDIVHRNLTQRMISRKKSMEKRCKNPNCKALAIDPLNCRKLSCRRPYNWNGSAEGTSICRENE